MNSNSIKAKLQPLITPHKLNIYSIKRKYEYGENIVEILLEGPNIDTDLLGEIHLKLHALLDDSDINPNYFLEVSSVGAEYPLRDLEHIKDHIGSYVYVEANKFMGMGLLKAVDGNILTVYYNDKGQFRNKKIEYDTVRKIRTSVKI